MDYETAKEALEGADWYHASGRRSVRTLLVDLAALDHLAKRGELPDEEAPAIWYALVQQLRTQADFYERELIRYLRWERDPDRPMYWADIAEVVDANLSSKQAAHAKWKRLIDGDRREAGGPGRGGWPQGRARRTDQKIK